MEALDFEEKVLILNGPCTLQRKNNVPACRDLLPCCLTSKPGASGSGQKHQMASTVLVSTGLER